MNIGGIIVLAALIGLIPAAIAKGKGHSFGEWWLFGALLFIVALPMALVLKPNADEYRQCPHCLSQVPVRATVCARCSRDIRPAVAPLPKSPPTAKGGTGLRWPD